VFRFDPIPFEPDVLTRAHGTNERLPVAAFGDAVKYYIQLVRNLEHL
jgi:carboxypeptidase PM20D1